MSLDLERDARRLRRGLVIAAGATLAVSLAVAIAVLSPGWGAIQAASGAADRGISQQISCAGELDRCTTCHTGMLHGAPAMGEPTQPRVARPHPGPQQGHLQRNVGCTVCHGGTGRALDARQAHAMTGQAFPDPLLGPPHIQAACVRCHVPGARPGMERLVRGVNLFLGLGCPICHPLSGGGRGGWDFGPDLRSLGRRSLAFLEASLLDPAANFPQSTMPSFRHSFEHDRKALEDLQIFLESLALERGRPECSERWKSAALAGQPCTRCHAGSGGRASGRFAHRCVYLIERTGELSCRGCHRETVPEGTAQFGGTCPVIKGHLEHCTACHDGPEGGTAP